MAPNRSSSNPKLKQSSIQSFLQQKSKSNAIPNPPQNDTNAVSIAADYERIRQETIRRNQQFLQKLGLKTINPTSTATPTRKRPRPPPPPPSAPLRSSSRHLPNPPPSPPHTQFQEPTTQNLVESSVYRYACSYATATTDDEFSYRKDPSTPIVGFKLEGSTFRDLSLAKIYSIDVQFLNKDRFLIAAGGHGGFVSVYGGGDDVEGENVGPLLSWKGSSSWISTVKFAQSDGMKLLSSSNDGGVVVWDIGQQIELAMSPRVVAESKELHSGGIFAMDLFDSWIATASKDSSVVVSRVTTEGKLVADRNVDGHHSGVIRGISFGDQKDLLADCGADGRICILDTRLSSPCTLTIESHHSTGVNTVEWNKWNNFLVLSASKDPTLHLYDIRNNAEPIHTQFQGHAECNARTCHNIYRPCFVGEKRIATPGQGSKKISLFDIDKETLMSQGIIEYDANLVMFTEPGIPRLWSAARQINRLCPFTESQS